MKLTFWLIALALGTYTTIHGSGSAAVRNETFVPELDSYVAGSLRAWDIPGAAIAIVKDGRVLVAKGYGVRELGKREAVDADTLFDVASLSKAFTAAMIATLVDERRLSWDAPIRDVMPQIEFSDPFLTANVSLRDLLSHRTGLRNNAAPFRGHLTRPQVVQLFKHLKAWEPFRTRMVYSNVGYALAGEVAATVSGLTWEALVTQRLVEPLGLTRTTANYDGVNTFANVASGHVVSGKIQRPVQRGSERLSTAAAGAIHSSARDLATWMQFQLGDGTYKGKRIISDDSMSEMHAPHVFVPTTASFRSDRQLQNFAGYGLGWQVWDYRGHPMLWHSGNGDGQIARITLVPGSRLGVAMTTNSWQGDSAPLRAVTARILDHYLGLPTRDYNAEMLASAETSAREQADATAALERARLKDSAPALPLTGYVGRYQDQLGLELDVSAADRTLVFRYAGGERATLEHWQLDTFRVSWTTPLSQAGPPAFLTFDIGRDGRVAGLRMELMRDRIEALRVAEQR